MFPSLRGSRVDVVHISEQDITLTSISLALVTCIYPQDRPIHTVCQSVGTVELCKVYVQLGSCSIHESHCIHSQLNDVAAALSYLPRCTVALFQDFCIEKEREGTKLYHHSGN